MNNAIIDKNSCSSCNMLSLTFVNKCHDAEHLYLDDISTTMYLHTDTPAVTNESPGTVA